MKHTLILLTALLLAPLAMQAQQSTSTVRDHLWILTVYAGWQAGVHNNPFGQRLTAFMISKGIQDSSVPMSILAGHPNVKFNYYIGGIEVCETEMH